MEGWTDGSVTISLCNFVGEGIESKNKSLRINNRGNTLESTSFNGF
jgi:hypothetical protein